MINSIVLHYFINKLPLKLIEIIRKFTYKPHHHQLMSQIKYLYYLKKKLYNIYFKIYKHELDSDILAIENWIDNDISLFINDLIPSIYCYSHDTYDILSRNIIFNSQKKIDSFIQKELTINVNSRINIYLSLFTKHEIKNFLRYIERIYY